MDTGKIISTKRVELNLALYESFYDHPWARSLAERVPGVMSEAVGDLLVTWKEAANTHRMPWLMIQQMEAFVGGYLTEHRPTGMRLIDLLKIRLRGELNGSVRNMGIKKIEELLDKIDGDFRESEKDHQFSVEPLKYWDMLVRQPEFQLSILGSQSLAYCALVFGYEWFLVRCFRLLGGNEDERPSDKRFWASLTALIGNDPWATYWNDREVKIARLARNCIAHLGGRAKQELLDEGPALYMCEGVITIQPSDNRDLYAALKAKVWQLTDEVIAKLPS